MELENVVIVGSGPAGLTAALYAARANLNPILITGNEFGGQVAITADVENYPGFPEVVTGPELVERMRAQAERFGARFEYDEVTSIDFSGWPHKISTSGNSYEAKAVIITTGASPKRLEVPGERENIGKGVSYCATCDGFFFRGKDLVVVGGGDSAVEEGLFLTKFANKVRIIHRRDTLRAGPLLQQRAFSNPKMEFIWDTRVLSISGDGKVESIVTENLKTGAQQTLATDGVFVYVGHYPNSGLFKGILDMDEHGYLLADDRKRTNLPGIFAAGEIADPIYRQVVTSAGEGCKAAMQVEKWLANLEHRPEPGGPGRSLASW